ncbi:MAG TPA: CoA transferase [Actinomycetota bacterium]|nr:CoA transferase [Actinomycetota bacterium]
MTAALEGIRVLDIGTVIAGPGIAARLGDFGADVIKVEHPRSGDTSRTMGWSVDGVALWWKWVGRNKRPVTLDLSHPKGQELLLRLAETADVLVESFRPGTLERWNLAPDALHERNPRLVIARVSGFGQTGPYRLRPGFGTLAESISGFAHMNGSADGPPILPPVALADEVAALLGGYAVMVALYRRDAGGEGRGQVIDLSLFESLFSILGPIPAAHATLGEVPGRMGNAIPYAAPRGAYPTADGRWIGISGTSQAVALRILAVIGGDELAADPRFATNAARRQHRDELDALIADWTSRRTLVEAMEVFERAHTAAAPIYDIADIVADPQYRSRGTLTEVPDDELGAVTLAEVHPKLSQTPGRIRHAGRPMGSANAEVYGEVGLSEDELATLGREGVV